MRERRFIRGCAVDAGKSRPASAQRARYCFIHELTGRNRPGASAAALFSAAIDRGPVGRVARALRAVSRRGHPPLRMRRPVAIPRLAGRRGAARDRGAGAGRDAHLQAPERAGGRARRRHRPVRRRHAAQPGRAAGSVKFNRIRRIDLASATAVVEPGVRNLAISEAAAPTACTMRPIPPARSPVPLAATWPRIPAACIA